MRLIDADRIKQSVTNEMLKAELNSPVYCTLECVIADIDSQPTAFDLESVIERLQEELKTYKLDMADTMLELMKKDKLGNYVCLEDAIEIIKSAANATNGKNGG